jgi:ribonuclease J
VRKAQGKNVFEGCDQVHKRKFKVQLTIHRGTKEIGGSCVEVSTSQTRIILDVGLPLVTADREPFDPKATAGKTTEVLIAERVIPDVPGLFLDGKSPDAILLSHSHLDHSGLLHLTKPEIPIFASSGTSKMMLATAVFSRQQQLSRSRHQEVRAKQTFTVGDINVTPFAVDHSSYGSVAYLIEAGEKSLLYSGDIRKHGRKPGMARELVAEIAPRNIDVLLMEGTHFGSGRSNGRTEGELEEEIVGHIQSAPGIVFPCFSPIDVDRLVTYYRASQRASRTFVVDVYTAFVMHLVASEAKIPRPHAKAGVRVYFNQAFEGRNLNSISSLFERDRISLSEILKQPSDYVMVFRPSMAELDFGNVLPKSVRCLYSYWKGYLDRLDWVQLRKLVDQAQGDFISAHTSGHIYADDLVSFVQSINPKEIVPIHTFEPTEFTSYFKNVRLLSDGQPYWIE